MLSAGVSSGRADFVAASTAEPSLLNSVAAEPPVTPPPTPTPVAVTIEKDGFHPSSLHINPGQSVTWTNGDSTAHTATAADGSWDTGPIDPGRSITLQFFELGHWDYVCGFKPLLRATLVVATPAPSHAMVQVPAPALSPTAPPTSSPTPIPTPSTGG